MSFLSSIFKWILAIIKKIVNFVLDIIKKYWYIIAIAALIYFAPAIGAFLASSGAPAWLTTAFTWVGANVTPLLVAGISQVGTWLAAGATSAWTAFTGASLATQATILAGVGMLLAPEETATLIEDTAEFASEVLYDVTSAVAGGVFSSIPTAALVVGAGIGLWWLFGSRKDKEKDERSDKNSDVQPGLE